MIKSACSQDVKNSSLQILVLDNNLLSNKDAELIILLTEKFISLRILSLQCNKFGPYSGKLLGRALSVSVSLESINVSHNQINDDGLKAILDYIPSNKTIREFYASNIRATQECIIDSIEKLFYGTHKLEHISFDFNKIKITERLIKVLKKLIENCETLQMNSLMDANRPPADPTIKLDDEFLSKVRLN